MWVSLKLHAVFIPCGVFVIVASGATNAFGNLIISVPYLKPNDLFVSIPHSVILEIFRTKRYKKRQQKSIACWNIKTISIYNNQLIPELEAHKMAGPRTKEVE